RFGSVRMVMEALAGYDIVFNPGFGRFAQLFFAIPERLRSHVRTVEWIEAYLLGQLDHINTQLVRNFNELYHRMDRYVAVTDWALETTAHDFGIRADRVIPVGVDTKVFTPPARREHAQATVLFVGTIMPRKHPEIVIEAATRMPDTRFVLAGA